MSTWSQRKALQTDYQNLQDNNVENIQDNNGEDILIHTGDFIDKNTDWEENPSPTTNWTSRN